MHTKGKPFSGGERLFRPPTRRMEVRWWRFLRDLSAGGENPARHRLPRGGSWFWPRPILTRIFTGEGRKLRWRAKLLERRQNPLAKWIIVILLSRASRCTFGRPTTMLPILTISMILGGVPTPGIIGGGLTPGILGGAILLAGVLDFVITSDRILPSPVLVTTEIQKVDYRPQTSDRKGRRRRIRRG